MALRSCMVLTTINDPVLLEGYYENFSKYSRLDQVSVIVIPDRKTPSGAFTRCVELSRKGLRVSFPTLEEQDSFAARAGFPPHAVPRDSDNRRNIGYLMALRDGADFVMSIDDDNHCRAEEDFFQEHAVVCAKPSAVSCVESRTGWFNICSLLQFDREAPVYPRGFPYSFRHVPHDVEEKTVTADVHLNAGLWINDPDIDGISWLVAPVRGLAFRGTSVHLGGKTWSPINTQNTALRREAVAAYYFFRMGYPLAGVDIDRYGDIFSGYFVQAVTRHLGGTVRVGTPVADHRRNSHNYMRDAAKEWACITLLEDLLPWLVEYRLSGKTYAEAYRSLAAGVEEAVESFAGAPWTDAARGYFHQAAFLMRKWADACSFLL